MGKRIEIDGKFYRERRGKLVEIPLEWLGKIPTEKTIRQRPSKMIRKHRRACKTWRSNWPAKKTPMIDRKEGIDIEREEFGELNGQ